jgi:uncharacterized membrane protein
MDLYLILKFLHVVGAAILFGTGLGIAFFLYRAERRETPAGLAATLRGVVIADYLFTATAAVAQPVTGFLLVYLRGYSLEQSWIVLSLVLYALAGACWLPVVAIQVKMRNLAERAAAAGEKTLPPGYRRLSRIWFWLGWPAFLSILAIFWLMIAKPA